MSGHKMAPFTLLSERTSLFGIRVLDRLIRAKDVVCADDRTVRSSPEAFFTSVRVCNARLQLQTFRLFKRERLLLIRL
jgi:hypothetical protein